MEEYENEISNKEMEDRNEEDDSSHLSSPDRQPHADANVQTFDNELLEEMYFNAEDKPPSQPNPHVARNKKPAKRRRKRTRNPFIAFFLSMYSRRPRARAADVAQQAGRQWCRMSDRQRQRCAERMLSDQQEKRSCADLQN